MNRPFRFTRRHAALLAAVVVTLVLSVVFDRTVVATALFPALWVATLPPSRCRGLSAPH